MLAWRIDVLDNANQWQGTLGDDAFPCSVDYSSGSISTAARESSLAIEVHTAAIDTLDWLQMRLNPVVTVDGTDYSMGIFVPLLQPYEITASGVTWKLSAKDQSELVMGQMSTSGGISGVDGNMLAGGTSIVGAVETLLTACGIGTFSIADPLRVLVQDKAWEIGTTYQAAIDELLSCIGYYPLRFDRDGLATSKAHVPLAEATPTLSFDVADDPGVKLSITPRTEQIANVCVVISEDDQRGAIGVRYTDDSPTSPTSTTRLGLRKVIVVKDNAIQNEEAALIRARSELERRARSGLGGDLELPFRTDLDLYDVIEISSPQTGALPFLVESLSISMARASMTARLSTAIDTAEQSGNG